MEAHPEVQTLADPTASRDARLRGPIVLDGAFQAFPTGIGTYSRELLKELRVGTMGGRIATLAPPPGVSRTLWMVGQVEPKLRSLKANLFHGLANFDLPLQKPPGMRYVLTVQDLIPLEWPEAVSRPYRLQFQVWLTRCLELADAVVCTTQIVADALQDRFPRVPSVRVIPLGVQAPEPTPAEAASTAEPNGPRYFFALGSLEVRKNVAILGAAFEQLPAATREGVELWVAGQMGFRGGPILAALERAGVKYLGPQPATALGALMRGALAFCAPSLAEGFGLPPLEAMALGTPVLASDIPAHREVLGDAAELLPASDPEAWAAAMTRLATNPALGTTRGAAGAQRAAQLPWSRTARATERLYRELLRE